MPVGRIKKDEIGKLVTIPCPNCDGSGRTEENEDCPECEGKGRVSGKIVKGRGAF